MKKKFLRRDAKRFSKFGKGRGKKAKWRKPTGRDNKMREKRKGYPSVVGIGNKKEKRTRGKHNGKETVMIMNLKDLEKIGKNKVGIVGKLGKKAKIEIAKKAQDLKVELKNMNFSSFLKKNQKKKKEKPEGKKEEKIETKKQEKMEDKK